MTPITLPDELSALLRETWAQTRAERTVLCLCARWCSSCREFAAAFQQAAEAHPDTRFRWLDIDDDADLIGDYEVTSFPTLIVGGPGGQPLFAGPVPPQAAQIARLLRPHVL